MAQMSSWTAQILKIAMLPSQTPSETPTPTRLWSIAQHLSNTKLILKRTRSPMWNVIQQIPARSPSQAPWLLTPLARLLHRARLSSTWWTARTQWIPAQSHVTTPYSAMSYVGVQLTAKSQSRIICLSSLWHAVCKLWRARSTAHLLPNALSLSTTWIQLSFLHMTFDTDVPKSKIALNGMSKALGAITHDKTFKSL